MQVQTINSPNFESKNTFLKKSKNAISRQDKDYWRSLHYEAKARLDYKKFNEAEYRWAHIEDTGSILGFMTSVAMFSLMVFRKLQSVVYDTKSYSLFPNRFAEPDDFDVDVKEDRYYKIKENYPELIKN